MKYYKLYSACWMTTENVYNEKLTFYKHSYGIQRILKQYAEVPVEAQEITREQYARIRRLILSKLGQNV